ncbi:alcohol oxidase [Thozetella sp. PMI_491]|nr:alcohol oxidase [Thozetella sp. PMI_491]
MFCLSIVLAAVLLAVGSGRAHGHLLYSSSFGYPGFNATYDYVVVGGGTAGLVLAARLAKDASVAVIEAGGLYEIENSNTSVVPLLSLTGIAFIDSSETFTPQPLMDWGLLSEPIPEANGRRTHYAQGKTLGGSSEINTMSYVRGTKSSYRRLADMVGDDSWTFDELLKYFKRSCELTPPNTAKRNNLNVTIKYEASVFPPTGTGGHLQVSWNNWVDATLTWLAKAVGEMGLTISPKGFNSGEKITGYGAWVPSTIDPANTHRSSAESSFLQYAIENGRKLSIYTHTQATKILFDNATPPRAVGVDVNTQGAKYTISASKEVVVSAGTFHSPQLLMVSGIGPRATLESLGIPVLVDLPKVGQNLRDPIRLAVQYPVNTPCAQSLIANPSLVGGFVEEYLKNATGPFTSAAGFVASDRIPAHLRQSLSQETRDKLTDYPEDWPEVNYIVSSYLGPNLTVMGTTTAWLPVSFSRGNVTTRSASMTDAPIINLNWLSDPADSELGIAAIRRLREIWATDAATSIKTGPEFRPGADVQTDSQILSYIRATVSQTWSASGTCSMGKDSQTAVVDSKGRVFGVGGLRVADGSILPLIIPAHPQATVYAIGEKIAEDILKADS